jgi:hypothetical protein
LRDLCSDLIAPAEAQPAWADVARPLAQEIYCRRDFGRLATLGHVIWHAGCRDERLLLHCHSPGPHSRGCWALDLLLGKG